MGRDKARLPFGDQTFLSHLISIYSQAFPVYVSLSVPGQFPHPGARELVDLRPEQGPLAGLETALLQLDAEAVFVTATDLPFGSVSLARTLLNHLENHDACVIRRRDGQIETAFGVYRKTCLPVLQSLLDQGYRAFRRLLEGVDVCWVAESELPEFDLSRILMNVNTPECYQQMIDELENESRNE